LIKLEETQQFSKPTKTRKKLLHGKRSFTDTGTAQKLEISYRRVVSLLQQSSTWIQQQKTKRLDFCTK
jgi:hypothetical protein